MESCLKTIDNIKERSPTLEKAILISAQLIMKNSLLSSTSLEYKTKLGNAIDLICKLRDKEREASAASGFAGDRAQYANLVTSNRGGKSRRDKRKARKRRRSKRTRKYY